MKLRENNKWHYYSWKHLPVSPKVNIIFQLYNTYIQGLRKHIHLEGLERAAPLPPVLCNAWEDQAFILGIIFTEAL